MVGLSRRSEIEVDDARLLPRHRTPIVERAAMERAQAGALLAAIADDPAATISLRHELTKPGDEDQLRGLPAIGRGVQGVQPGTDPLREVMKREHERERRLRKIQGD